jgi:PBP1b-binding outer membrane lipoprotein LpoB
MKIFLAIILITFLTSGCSALKHYKVQVETYFTKDNGSTAEVRIQMKKPNLGTQERR